MKATIAITLVLVACSATSETRVHVAVTAVDPTLAFDCNVSMSLFCLEQ